MLRARQMLLTHKVTFFFLFCLLRLSANGSCGKETTKNCHSDQIKKGRMEKGKNNHHRQVNKEDTMIIIRNDYIGSPSPIVNRYLLPPIFFFCVKEGKKGICKEANLCVCVDTKRRAKR